MRVDRCSIESLSGGHTIRYSECQTYRTRGRSKVPGEIFGWIPELGTKMEADPLDLAASAAGDLATRRRWIDVDDWTAQEAQFNGPRGSTLMIHRGRQRFRLAGARVNLGSGDDCTVWVFFEPIDRRKLPKMKCNRFFSRGVSKRSASQRGGGHLQRRLRWLTLLLTSLTWLWVWGHPGTLEAQFFERALVLEGVHIPGPDGRVLEDSNIILRGGRIVELGPDSDAPMMSKKIKVKGLFATAGLCSTLTLDDVQSSSAIHSAWDGFDRYDSQQILRTLASGVTKIHLIPMGPGGIVGRVSSLSLGSREEGGYGILHSEDVALCIDLDSGTPLERIRTYEKVRGALKSAQKMRESLDDYTSDLEEYIEDLAEAAKKKAEEKAEEKDKEKDDKDDKDDKAEDGDGDEKDEKGEKDKDSKKEDGPKKPDRLERDPAAEILLQVLDHELPVMITARRSADLQNAIDLIEEFQLSAILRGADEAHLVLEALAELEKVSLLLEVSRPSLTRGAGPRRDPHLIAQLDEEGISWAVGSGGNSTSLWRSIQQLSGQLSTASPLPLALAQGAQGPFGGWLRRGAKEVILWEGNPAEDPLARPNRVIINGTVVWQRPSGTREGSF